MSIKDCLSAMIESLKQHAFQSNVTAAGALVGFAHGETAKVDRFSSYLPWIDVTDDNLFVLRGLSDDAPEGLGYTLEIAPQTGASDAMQQSLIGLAAGLPVGSVLTVSCYASPVITGYTDAILPTRQEHEAAAVTGSFDPLSASAHETLLTANARQADHLKNAAYYGAVNGTALLPRHFRVWLSVVIPTSTPYDNEVQTQVKEFRRAQASILQQSNLYRGVWTPDTLVATAAELVNPHEAHALFTRPCANPFEPPAAQVALPDTQITVGLHGITFKNALNGNQQCPLNQTDSGLTPSPVKAIGLTLTRYPKDWNLLAASNLLGEFSRAGTQIPCPFIMSSHLQVADETAEKLRADSHRLRALQMQQSPLSNFTPYYHEQVREWNVAVNAFRDQGGIGQVGHTMVLFSPAGQEAPCINAAQAIARKAGGQWRQTTALHSLAYMASLPMCAGPLLAGDMQKAGFWPRRTVATALGGAPVVTEWQGTRARADASRPTPLMTLVGRRGQLMPVDPFANRAGGYSAAIIGMPGAGKSVVMNQISTAVLSRGGIVWIIDIGRSYEKSCRMLNGEFLEFSADHIWDLNPLSFVARADQQADRIEDVVSILSELVSPGAALPDYQRSVLMSAVTQACDLAQNAGRTARLTDLDQLLSEHPNDQRICDLRVQLRPYIDGPLSVWFNGQGRRINFSSRYTVLELEGLSGHKALRQAVLLTLMLHIEHAMSAERTLKKAILIDEAWDLMGAGHAGRFIESGFRRARKHNAGFFVATQSAQDFFQSDTARAAWRCADTRIYMRQDVSALETLNAKGVFQTTAAFRDAVASLTTVAGAWSEMLVQVGDQPPAIGRLSLDRTTQVLYSTLPAEFEAVRRWIDAGASMAHAVTAVAQGKMNPEGTIEARHE